MALETATGTAKLGGVQIAQDHEDLLASIRQTRTQEGQGAFWWLGQHTFIVQAGGKVFYFDPWLADWESRKTPRLLTPQEAQQADFALITHGHGDHLYSLSCRRYDTIRWLARDTGAMAPTGCDVPADQRAGCRALFARLFR